MTGTLRGVSDKHCLLLLFFFILFSVIFFVFHSPLYIIVVNRILYFVNYKP